MAMHLALTGQEARGIWQLRAVGNTDLNARLAQDQSRNGSLVPGTVAIPKNTRTRVRGFCCAWKGNGQSASSGVDELLDLGVVFIDQHVDLRGGAFTRRHGGLLQVGGPASLRDFTSWLSLAGDCTH